MFVTKKNIKHLEMLIYKQGQKIKCLEKIVEGLGTILDIRKEFIGFDYSRTYSQIIRELHDYLGVKRLHIQATDKLVKVSNDERKHKHEK